MIGMQWGWTVAACRTVHFHQRCTGVIRDLRLTGHVANEGPPPQGRTTFLPVLQDCVVVSAGCVSIGIIFVVLALEGTLRDDDGVTMVEPMILIRSLSR